MLLKLIYLNIRVAVVFADLLDRDISKFKPLCVAPHTIYRDTITTLADKAFKDYVKEKFAQIDINQIILCVYAVLQKNKLINIQRNI